MRKRIEWQWEVLDTNTARAKVMGGWLVLHLQQTFGSNETSKKADIKIINSESMVFIPDREHEWTVIPPIDTTVATAKNQLAKDFSS